LAVSRALKTTREEQAKMDCQSLERCFEVIASEPRLGREMNDADQMVRVLPFDQLTIVYLIIVTGVLAVRILSSSNSGVIVKLVAMRVSLQR
jgi:plasmid stabilization system protein ParE